MNGALLFGRQRTKVHHHKTSVYQSESAKYYPSLRSTVYHTATSPARSKNVTVPNLGGYAALSLRYNNAKVSFGYRIDLSSAPSTAASMRRKRKTAPSTGLMPASLSA